jgi:branched-subunit amino acid aminotransferase/4-amino-4-deoxychorismate lyase
MPVVQIDDRTVANGEPGSLTRSLQDLYAGHVGAGA